MAAEAKVLDDGVEKVNEVHGVRCKCTRLRASARKRRRGTGDVFVTCVHSHQRTHAIKSKIITHVHMYKHCHTISLSTSYTTITYSLRPVGSPVVASGGIIK